MAAPTRLSHVDDRGRVRMVDVGDKAVTTREAIASRPRLDVGGGPGRRFAAAP